MHMYMYMCTCKYMYMCTCITYFRIDGVLVMCILLLCVHAIAVNIGKADKILSKILYAFVIALTAILKQIHIYSSFKRLWKQKLVPLYSS